MTSFKSSHAFEGLLSSGFPGRPPLPKNATPNFTAASASDSHSTTDPRDVATAKRRSDSVYSGTALDFSSFSQQPHSIPFSSSHAAFSTSVVREQSLALGNLERSFDSNPASPVTSSQQDSASSVSGSSGAASTANKIGAQQQLGKDHKRDGPNRSPPSGLSLLLKTKDQEDSKNKNQNRSTETQADAGSGTGPGSGPEPALGSGFGTAKGAVQALRKHASLSPPPAPIDTSLAKYGSNADVERAFASKPKHPAGKHHALGAAKIASSSSLLAVPAGSSASSSTETDSLLPRHPSEHSSGYSTITPMGDRRWQEPLHDDDSLSSMLNEFRRTRWTRKVIVQKCIVEPVGFIPAVILGLLLNLLDAVSYGMIIFPLNISPFQALGPDGISMFFVSCVVSQLVYSLGGSAFKGGNGSMMIEVVPFLHLMAETVVARVGADNRDAVLATTILAYALSTIMTGLVFLALGYFKLGSLIAFFPRHILVGCIGGVGWFLIITGLEVSSRMTSELTYTLETFKFLFMDRHVFALWSSAFGLALLLRALQHKIRHPFLVPIFFMVVPALFYTIVAIAGFDWEMLRANGWVFPMPEGDAPGWQFYSYFSLELTDWRAILETVPAMLALTFFGILHVPINVPALGVSTGQDNIDTNRELVAHGWSNLLSGGAGTVQNYLVYTNSLLFIKSGGDSRVAGVMLAIASLVIFLVGPWIVGYIPVMVVGSLIFHLGLDLVKEAMWDTWGLVHPLEYLTIALIVVAMAGFGFVEGIFLGILLACVFFVVTNSRKEGVRYSCTGESAKSTVRRVYRQQKFLRQVGRQIYIFKLQGDMFFGTINKVEKEIQDVFSRRRWEVNPIQFLVLDFSLVRNVDFSAAEGFGRIRRAVHAKGVCLVLSGLDEEGEVGKALQMVGVWGAGAGAGLGEGHGHGANFSLDGFDTQSFPGLSEALEYCENCLLESYYRTRETTLELAKRKRLMEIANQDESSVLSPDSETTRFFAEHMQHSPRKSQIFEAAQETLHAKGRPYPQPINLQQPVPTLLAAFHDTRENPTDFFLRLSMYFERRTVLAETVLWRQGGSPIDGIYLVEDGTLRSTQEFQDSGLVRRSVEVILPGTISGEIGLFTGNDRSSTVVSETDSILWGLNQERFQKMVKEDPALAVEFMRVAMSYSAERLNTMAAYAFNLS
ncbi:sulfate transporter family-domain-containing protein [Dissophora ornata]|nr:sulfate transporter family-domain-containing protein [Dissophora ornata]